MFINIYSLVKLYFVNGMLISINFTKIKNFTTKQNHLLVRTCRSSNVDDVVIK